MAGGPNFGGGILWGPPGLWRFIYYCLPLCLPIPTLFCPRTYAQGDTDTDLEFLQRPPNDPDRATSLLFTNLALPPSISANTSQPHSATGLMYERTPHSSSGLFI